MTKPDALDLCPDCKVEPQTGFIGRYFYKRCPYCMAKHDAKVDENRAARLRRQAEAIRTAGSQK